MKILLIPTFILGSALTAQAQDISSQIATNGLSATEAALAALSSPTPTEQFALGGVRFLGAIETALQTRYNTAINDGLAVDSGLPVLRLPLPPNPNPDPFTPGVITGLFERISAELARALEPLDTIGDTDDVGLVINTGDLWFDINSNGARDPGEGMTEIAGWVLTPRFGEGPDMVDLTIRFDTADAAWLSAYAHLLSGVSEAVLAVDPTEAITGVLDARTAFAEFGLPGPSGGFIDQNDLNDFIDLVAMYLHAMDQQIDPVHSQAAHAHLLGMIEDNQVFWARLDQEQDNEMEWIPNATQTSALPIPFPPELGATWQTVLADAEDLLNGDQLLPFWRTGDDVGINLASFMQNPPQLDPVGLLQGDVFLPYLERGRIINGASLTRFERMLGGDAGLFMVILN